MTQTPEIVMYSTAWCGYCQRARNLLERKGLAVREIKIDEDPQERAAMMQKSGGRRTVPQIFIGERHIGGYE
ncbi:glutaredoxin 3, partial [Salmonella enterica]|uniref:glutaredoxin 3 n=1 Tax=Salmonella enterica TaxID=28901 RepID=UPI003298BE85